MIDTSNMPITSIENLFTLLQKPAQRLTIITQSDPFLSVWAEQTLLEYWYQKNIKERIRLHEVSSKSSFTLSLTQNDLFSTKKTWLIDCSKPNIAKEWQLDQIIKQSLAQTQHEFIIQIANLTGGSTRSSWYKNLCDLGLHLPTKTLPNYKIPNWLAQYSKLVNKPLPISLCNTLCEQNHYHLPALTQIVKQMQAQNLQPPFTHSTLTSCKLSAPCSQPIFDVLDDIFLGNISKFSKAIAKNYPQDTLINLYWLLIKRLRQVLSLHEQHRLTNSPINNIMQKENIWTKQQKMFVRCLKTPHEKLYSQYLAFCKLEWVLKGRYPGNFSAQMIQQCQQLCHTIYAH